MSNVRRLRLKVREARNLLAKDLNGFSDPYCKISHGRWKEQTPVIQKSLNPVWGVSFDIPLDPRDPIIQIDVMDKDFASNEFLGRVVIHQVDLADEEQTEWYPLQPKKNTGIVTGDIRLSTQLFGGDGSSTKPSPNTSSSRTQYAALEAVTPEAPERNMMSGLGDLTKRAGQGLASAGQGLVNLAKQPQQQIQSLLKQPKQMLQGRSPKKPPPPPPDVPYNVIVVKVIEARNLGSAKYDPYCQVSHGGANMRTAVVDDNMHPRWNEQFVLDIMNWDTNVKLEVFDKNLITADDLLGVISLRLEDYQDGHAHDEWHLLEHARSHGGSRSRFNIFARDAQGELHVCISLEHREDSVAVTERRGAVRESIASPATFEGVYWLGLILVVAIISYIFNF